MAPSMHKTKTVAKRHGTVSARATPNQRGYTYRWQRFREQYLIKHPLCVHCQEDGMYTPAIEVDHITPHCGDQKLFWNLDNLQALCKSCHSKKTRKEQSLCLV